MEMGKKRPMSEQIRKNPSLMYHKQLATHVSDSLAQQDNVQMVDPMDWAYMAQTGGTESNIWIGLYPPPTDEWKGQKCPSRLI